MFKVIERATGEKGQIVRTAKGCYYEDRPDEKFNVYFIRMPKGLITVPAHDLEARFEIVPEPELNHVKAPKAPTLSD